MRKYFGISLRQIAYGRHDFLSWFSVIGREIVIFGGGLSAINACFNADFWAKVSVALLVYAVLEIILCFHDERAELLIENHTLRRKLQLSGK